MVPLLLGAAYHSQVDIPAALSPAGALATQADVLGPDPLLVAALERRLAEAGVAPGDRDTAVVLAAAGSTEASSLDAVRALAAGWRGAGWWAVEPAFASAAEPTVESAVAALRGRGAPRVAVATYLLFPGLFADKLAAAGADVVSAPLAAAPEVVELVLARYDAAVTGVSRGPATDPPTRPHPPVALLASSQAALQRGRRRAQRQPAWRRRPLTITGLSTARRRRPSSTGLRSETVGSVHTP